MGGRGSSILRGGGDAGKAVTQAAAYSKALKTVEDRIRDDSTETAVVLDKNGNILVDKSDGAANSVSFTAAEVQKMKDATLTHNHPRCTTFSPEDLNMIVEGKLATIRATSSIRTYQLSRMKTSKADDTNFARDFKQASAGFEKTLDTEYYSYRADYRSGKMSAAMFNLKIDDLNSRNNRMRSDWLKDNAKNYGYRYSVQDEDFHF